jgi:SPP1 family predicted phage head-tail adaptor
MRAGKLTERITIQSLTLGQDTFGDPTKTWTDFETVWASVEPLQGREYYAAQQMQSEVTTRFRIRYLEGLDTTMSIMYAGERYNIISIIDPNERHRELHLMAKK